MSERESIIASARELADGFDQLVRNAAGPGAYEGLADRELVMAIDVLFGHGGADESGGDSDTGAGHAVRCAQYVVFTDTAGFRFLQEFGSEEEASAAVAECAEAAAWAEPEELAYDDE